MSELLQAGQHPDADQLNAFVEHTLPAHEQQQTLAHLALCPACRQIVALSLPPVDEAPILRPEAVRHRWFPRWHPAWAGIPALAALILLVLFVRNGEKTVRQTSVPAQVADARPPAPPPAVPSPASVPPEAALNASPPAQHLHQKRAVPAATQPPSLADARPEPPRGSASGVMGGILGGIGSGPASQPRQELTQQGRSFAPPSASIGGPVMALAAGRARSVPVTPGPLPSHLTILSMASNGNQRLAIDTGNHLFFSDNEGRDWKAVPSQWKGRAVRVTLTSAVSFGSAVPALQLNARPAATTAPTLSGTVTDPAGAVIPGATLAATNSSGVLVRTVITDRQGQFRMEGLPPGSYRLEARARGFKTQSFSAEVVLSQQAVADVTLRVASAAQTVTIEASPAAPETASAAANPAAKPPGGQTLLRFELTTDEGERWTSTDGQTWARE